ncbi:hypothetical protein DV737_g4931, partial [Chaetothyriales sp. CBS 132003]
MHETRALLRLDDSRLIIHFDYDCFYASVVEAENPALKLVPLAIQQKQIVVTCNYEARRLGLHKLQLITEAKKVCPDVVIVLGEDLTKFRAVSKDLYNFLRAQIWSDRAERLGFDEVWLDCTDMVEYNLNLLGPNNLANSFFCLDKDDPTRGFAFDATAPFGPTCPEQMLQADASMRREDRDLQLRVVLGSHLAGHLRHALESQKGYTATVGVAPNKTLAKLVGSVNKPKNQTAILPPYEPLGWSSSTVTHFMDGHEIGKVPGIGFKLAQRLRARLLGQAADAQEETFLHTVRQPMTVGHLRTHPGMGPEMLQDILGGPGSQKGIGVKIWELLHGIDRSQVAKAKRVPSQLSQEDSYKRHLRTFDEVKEQLYLLSLRLIRRMHLDLLEHDEDDDECQGQEVGRTKWLARPRTLRLSTRPRPPAGADGSRPRSVHRVSRSVPMPTFVFSLRQDPESLAANLVEGTLVDMFRKLHPEKSGWSLSLISIAITNMAETASSSATSDGRDIGRMFRHQEHVLKDFRLQDQGQELAVHSPPRDQGQSEIEIWSMPQDGLAQSGGDWDAEDGKPIPGGVSRCGVSTIINHMDRTCTRTGRYGLGNVAKAATRSMSVPSAVTGRCHSVADPTIVFATDICVSSQYATISTSNLMPASKRPKLSLQTSSLQTSHGMSASSSASNRIDDMATVTPTTLNTFNNTFDLTVRPSPTSATTSPIPVTLPRTKSNAPSPFRRRVPYDLKNLPYGVKPILKNSDLVYESLRGSVAASASPRGTRKVFFPPAKTVSFAAVDEEIVTQIYVARHIDLSSSEDESNLAGSGEGVAASSDNDGRCDARAITAVPVDEKARAEQARGRASTRRSQSSHQRRRKRRRWEWTIEDDADMIKRHSIDQTHIVMAGDLLPPSDEENVEIVSPSSAGSELGTAPEAKGIEVADEVDATTQKLQTSEQCAAAPYSNMGRERQKRKNRSSIPKSRPKDSKRTKTGRRKVDFGNSATMAKNWDRTLTLWQNYKRLGLSTKLAEPTGGTEQTGKDKQQPTKSDSLAIPRARETGKVQTQEVHVERDAETGRILRVLRPNDDQPGIDNPLNDPLNDILDGPRQEPSNTATVVIAALEREAAEEEEALAKRKPRQQSQREEEWLGRLVAKYGQDTRAMARDRKLNPMQQTEGDLRRRLRKYKQKQTVTD